MHETPLNRPIVIASALFFATAAIHAFMGGPEVNAVVQGSELHPLVRAVSAVVWHALTVLFLIFGGALFWVSRHHNPALVMTIIATNIAFVVLFLVIGISALGNVIWMPQWILFSIISAVMIWGLAREPAAV